MLDDIFSAPFPTCLIPVVFEPPLVEVDKLLVEGVVVIAFVEVPATLPLSVGFISDPIGFTGALAEVGVVLAAVGFTSSCFGVVIFDAVFAPLPLTAGFFSTFGVVRMDDFTG